MTDNTKYKYAGVQSFLIVSNIIYDILVENKFTKVYYIISFSMRFIII
jgi:hypothetical protein